eukprot:3709973-Alexandrium_andersonii.AAC.1
MLAALPRRPGERVIAGDCRPVIGYLAGTNALKPLGRHLALDRAVAHLPTLGLAVDWRAVPRTDNVDAHRFAAEGRRGIARVTDLASDPEEGPGLTAALPVV